ncbi:MAG TPA: T9SS type A sorting domain-containing protein [Bacteroidales bacterium]|nr:T9SS type A sorting domain-containing protein [Bacteroidales bacterium]HPS61423.1 T9SS type A sorting domain-containing protein [Bacteroidales bacterium]
MKKWVLFLFFGLFLAGQSHAQLTGTKSIPGDYATLAAAITDLNANGVGIGGVTFIVADGYTETFATPSAGLISTSSSNSSRPVLFTRSGEGTAPVITAAIGNGSADYIFCLSGTSSITFDGIAIRENPSNSIPEQQVEWGFAILKASATQGSQDVVIKNCSITLDKTNPGSTGIYMDNVTIADPAIQLTITDLSGTNSGNKFYNNVLDNVNRGIYLSGYADPNAPYSYYDQNNDIGSLGGNHVTNFGTGSQAVYGIYAAYQNGLTIANSTINGGDGSTGPVYGIYGGTANNASVNIYGNTITVTSAGTTAGLYGIYNAGLGNGGTSNTLNFYSNSLVNCTYPTATAAIFYGIYNVATAGTINLYSNTARYNTTGGTTQQYLIYTNSTAGNSVNVYNNQVSDNQCTGTGSQTDRSYIFGIQTIGWGNITIHDNLIYNLTLPAQNKFGAGIYGIHGGFSASNSAIYNNLIHDLSVAGSMTSSTSTVIYGIYSSLNSFTNVGTNSIRGNTIYNLQMTLSSTYGGYMYGIYCQYYNNLYSNNVSNLGFTNTSNGYGYGAGIYYSSNGIGYIHENSINNCSMGGTSAYFYGLQINGGDNVYAYNNMIADLNAPTSTVAHALSGIYVVNPVQAGIYNNSIYLNATSNSTGNFGTNGIYITTSALVDLRNNLIINTSSAPSSTTYKTVAYRRSSATFSTYATTSNYNDFFAGTPSATNLIFYDGTTGIQTLSDFKVFAVQRDANSISELPPFSNITTQPWDLHIKSFVPNQCESGGSVISGIVNITTDFDGMPRYPNPGYPERTGYPPTAPDMGAHEFGGIPLDLTPPSILFTPLGKTSSTRARSLNVTVQDASGVPTGGSGVPVLYWKRSAAGSWNAAPADAVNGNIYTFTFGDGVVLNDTVYYYIVAQDNVTPAPNVGATPSNVSGYSADPPACSVPPPDASCYSYKIVGSLCGTFQVGTGQTYPTLTSALNALNQMEVTCPVIFELTDATYPSETFPLTITNPTGVNAVNTVTIRPATGISTTFSGVATSILKLVQASYITIDGSNCGGSDRSLTFNNLSTSGTTATIWICSNGTGQGSTNDVIKNCNINNGYGTTTSYDIVIGSVTGIGTAGDDNDHITLLNNSIFKAYRGIYVAASANGVDDDLKIVNNTIGADIAGNSISNYGIYLAGTASPEVTGNVIYNMINNNAALICGIELNSNVSDAIIRNNMIHDLKSSYAYGPSVYGINIGTGSNVKNATLINNVIYNLTSTQYAAASTQYNPFGVRIVSGTGHKMYHNTINMAGTQSAPGSSASLSAALVFPYPIVTGLDIRDNIFANSIVGLAGSSSYCVYAVAGSTFGTLDYNDYYPSGTYGILGYFGSAQTSLPAWQAATGHEGHGRNIDPVFTSASNLIPTNPALGHLGIWLPAVPSDYAGVIRANPPDIGAYEFASNPVVNTDMASDIAATTATLNGSINAANHTVDSYFDYGTTTAYGSTVAGTPATVTGSSATPVAAALTGLQPFTTYHFRAKGVDGALTVYGEDRSFTTSSNIPVTIGASGTISNDTCIDATQTITVAGTPDTFTVTSSGYVTLIAGQNIVLLPGTTVEPGGYLWAYITTTNEYCGSPAIKSTEVSHDMPLIMRNNEHSHFSLYPNPAGGNITLMQVSDLLFDHVNIEVYTLQGERVFTDAMIGEKRHDLNLSGMASGLYFVKLIADGKVETLKLVRL